jgi:hypothetical protein
MYLEKLLLSYHHFGYAIKIAGDSSKTGAKSFWNQDAGGPDFAFHSGRITAVLLLIERP